MSHDDGPIVDVELLADLGYVAQRLRRLEKKWTIDLKELQQMSINGFGEPPQPTAISISPSLNELFASTQVDSEEDKETEDLTRQIKLLEDTVIKIYHQQVVNAFLGNILNNDCFFATRSSRRRNITKK